LKSKKRGGTKTSSFGVSKREICREVYRKLVVGGRACVNVANLGRRPYIPLHSYLIADMLEIGFIDGKEDPAVLVQDAPGVGMVFTRDRITYKVRHEYGGAVIDYRGFYKAVVA